MTKDLYHTMVRFFESSNSLELGSYNVLLETSYNLWA